MAIDLTQQGGQIIMRVLSQRTSELRKERGKMRVLHGLKFDCRRSDSFQKAKPLLTTKGGTV